MTITYATADELAAYVDPETTPAPAVPLATILIRQASQLVLAATRGAVYDTTPSGLPRDARILDAMREATLEQASAWSAHKIDPRKGAAGAPRQASSKALNGAQVAYVADPTRDLALSRLWSGTSLTEAAMTVLQNAGLITAGVRSIRAGALVNTPAVPGYESIYGGRPDDYYGPAPIVGVNI